MLKNYMEIAVEIILADIMKKEKLKCKCEQCLNDIRAITLNNLKPMYVVTDKGIVYTKIKELNTQFRADIIRELTMAIKNVEDNPRHD